MLTEILLTKVWSNEKHAAAISTIFSPHLRWEGSLCPLADARRLFGVFSAASNLFSPIPVALYPFLAILRVPNVTWRSPKATWCKEKRRASATKENCWLFLCHLLLQYRYWQQESQATKLVMLTPARVQSLRPWGIQTPSDTDRGATPAEPRIIPHTPVRISLEPNKRWCPHCHTWNLGLSEGSKAQDSSFSWAMPHLGCTHIFAHFKKEVLEIN